MPRTFYDYVDSGSWTESTYRANTSDFAATTLVGQPTAKAYGGALTMQP